MTDRAEGGYAAPVDPLYAIGQPTFREVAGTTDALIEAWVTRAQALGDQAEGLRSRAAKGKRGRKARRAAAVTSAQASEAWRCVEDLRLCLDGGGRIYPKSLVAQLLPTLTVPRGMIAFVAPPSDPEGSSPTG